MAGKKNLVAVALALKSLELGSHVDMTLLVVAYIKRYDANGVAGNEEGIEVGIIERKSKDAAEAFDELRQP